MEKLLAPILFQLKKLSEEESKIKISVIDVMSLLEKSPE